MFTKVTLCGKRCPPRSKQMVDNNEEKCCLQRQENLRERENHLFAFYPFLSGRSLFSFHCVVAPPPPPRSSEVTSPILPSQSQLIQPTGGRILQLSFAASCDFDLFLHSKVNPENGPTIQLCPCQWGGGQDPKQTNFVNLELSSLHHDVSQSQS